MSGSSRVCYEWCAVLMECVLVKLDVLPEESWRESACAWDDEVDCVCSVSVGREERWGSERLGCVCKYEE